MATKYWYGNGSGHEGDWAWDDSPSFATSNWHNASGTGVAKPVNGDTIIFSSTGASPVTTNLDQSALQPANFYVQPGNTQYIGTVSGETINHLKIGTVDGVVDIRGSGTVRLSIAASNPLIVAMAESTTYFALTGVIPVVRVYRGTGRIDDVLLLADIEIGQMDSQDDVHLTIKSTVGGVTASQWGGYVNLELMPDIWEMKGGGTCTQTLGAVPTLLEITTGATYYYSSTAASGTMKLVAHGGIFDARGCVGGFVLDSASEIGKNTTVRLDNGSNRVTGSFKSFEAMPIVDQGTVVTLA